MSNNTDGGHWYDQNGIPCHRQPTKAGSKNPTRPTTIRDARKFGLYPSVTTVMGVLSKPQLDRWKAQQITKAAYVQRPNDGELLSAYHDRIMTTAFLKVQQAADAGTLIHNAAELAMQHLEYDDQVPVFLPELNQSYPLKTFIDPIRVFIDQNEIETTGHELRLVNKIEGYAGMTDVAMRSKKGFGILDYKTRKTKPGYPCAPWDGQAMQIASYHVAHYHSVPNADSSAIGCNLFVSTTEPGRVEASWYNGEQLAQEWNAFKSCCTIWRHFNNYDPRQSLPKGC